MGGDVLIKLSGIRIGGDGKIVRFSCSVNSIVVTLPLNF